MPFAVRAAKPTVNLVLPLPVTAWTEVMESEPDGPFKETSAVVKLAGSIASEKVSVAPVAWPAVSVKAPEVTLAPVTSGPGLLLTPSSLATFNRRPPPPT